MSMPMGMPMMAGAAGAAPGAAADAEPVEEKTQFTVKLTGFDAKSKVKVIKEVRALAKLGLKEAKSLVESAPTDVLKDIKKEEAEQIMEKLKAVGAKVEMS
jgi:large subunit ribosomal protein L7/L12